MSNAAEIRSLLERGVPAVEIRRRLGVAKGTVSYHRAGMLRTARLRQNETKPAKLRCVEPKYTRGYLKCEKCKHLNKVWAVIEEKCWHCYNKELKGCA